MIDHSGKEIKVRQSRFPLSLFWMLFGICTLMSGLHQGLLVLMEELEWEGIVKVHITLLYWLIVAAMITLHVRRRMEQTYEIPLQMISDAVQKVAQGDFSIYIPPIHTLERLDYLDIMIMNINKMVEELGSIETLKTDFISNVSHEMKTPIAVMKNSAQMLQMRVLSEREKEEYAKNIESAANRLSNLITNILKLSKLDNQRIVPDVKHYDVCRQICECVLQFEDIWDEKEIELEMEIEERALVRGDESLLELVWNNLLSNAIKFTESGGHITIRQVSEKDHVKVSVSDTGGGMNQESMKHIFDKFYQGDTSHSKEGNGLGLALVKRIVELLDGEIQVFSKKGEGSTFTVILPGANDLENGG